MYSKIVFEFPKNKNNVDYFVALSQIYSGIIGGIIGGLFTVVGVGITVYIANKDRKNDLKKADKPKLMTGGNIVPVSDNIISPKLDDFYENGNKRIYLKNELSKLDKNLLFDNYNPFSIYLTDHADCILEGIILGDEMIYSFDKPYILIKGNTYTFDLSPYYFIIRNGVCNSITLICSSLEERYYFFSCSTEEEKKKINNHNILNVSVLSLEERIHLYEKKVKSLWKKLDAENTKYMNNLIKEKR